MYFESHPVHVNVLCICFVFHTCLFVHCYELDFIYAMAIFNLQTCMYANGILTQLPDLMRVIGHSCHFINEDLNIDFFSQKGYHMSDDRIDINFLSVNVRGLRNYVKRRKIFNWVFKHNGANSICFIQEAHSDYKTEKSLKHLWKGESFFLTWVHKTL